MRKLLCILLLGIACFAARGQAIIRIEDADVICGDTFYLNIRASQLVGISGTTLYIEFDSTHFRFSSDDWGAEAGAYRHSMLINPILDSSESLSVVSAANSSGGKGLIGLGWLHYFGTLNIDNDWIFKIRLINICNPISLTPLTFSFNASTNSNFCEINDFNGDVLPCTYIPGQITQIPSVNDSNIFPTPCLLSVNAGPDQIGALDMLGYSPVILSATVNGGTAPYQFLWNNGASNQNIIVGFPSLQTPYSVSVTDANGCTASDAVQVQWYVLPAFWSLTKAATMNACPGNVTFPIHVYFTDSIATISLHLAYDTSVLTYNGFQDADTAFANTINVTALNGIITINWTGTPAVNIQYAKLLALKFTGIPGSSSISWTSNNGQNSEFRDGSGNLIESEFADGKITFVNCVSIMGTVNYDNPTQSPITNALVTLKGPETISEVCVDNTGHYTFSNVPVGMYSLDVSTCSATGGINSTDALMVLKHYAGLVSLGGLQILAGDVNASNLTNAADALLIAKEFTGMVSNSVAGEWFFTEETVSVDGTSDITANLKALCYGDVNASFSPEAKITPGVSLECSGILDPDGAEKIRIPITCLEDMEVGAISLVMQIPSECFSIQDITTTLSGNFLFNVIGNELRISWYNTTAGHLAAGDTLLEIICSNNSIHKNPCNMWLLTAESQFADGHGVAINDVRLGMPAINTAVDQFYLAQNVPNPLITNCDIAYYLPEPGKVTLKVFTAGGILTSILCEDYQEAGQHVIHADLQGLPPGIYFYQLSLASDTRYYSATKRMMVLR